jgi:prephenate dehydrogenase
LIRVGIVGQGLIGGSLGMALSRLGQGVEVVGLTRSSEAAREAERRHAVSRASTDVAVMDGADIVVIATPIDQVAPVLGRLTHLMTSGTVISDVASVKRPVRDWVRRIPEPGLFLGGHPVAGKTAAGIESADPDLFQDEPWIFTPLEAQNLHPFEALFELVGRIGGRVTLLSPEEHDRQMAYLSHLAFTISAAFAQTVRSEADPALAGPGYRSMARLADGDPTMYVSIAAENRQPLLDAIDRFSGVLEEYRDRIQRREAVLELFEGATHAPV